MKRVLLALVLCACGSRPVTTQTIARCEVSEHREGPYREISTEDWTGIPTGAGRTWLRLTLPAPQCEDPVLHFPSCRGLLSARVGGRPVPVSPDYCFWIPVTAQDAGAQV